MRAMKNQERRCPISHGSQVASYACSLRMSSRSSDLRPGEATLRDTAAAPAVEPVRTLLRPRGADLVELAKPRLNLLVVVSTVVGYALGARACRLRRFGPYRCGISPCGVPRPSLVDYVTVREPADGAPAAGGC